MEQLDLLGAVIRALYLGLALAAAWQWARGRPRGSALTLMLGTLALTSLLEQLIELGLGPRLLLEGLSALSLMLHPLLLLELVHALRPVPTGLRWGAAGATVGSVIALLIASTPPPAGLAAVLLAIWVGLEGACAALLLISARRSQGVRRWRLGLAAAGGGALAAIILSLGLSGEPGPQGSLSVWAASLFAALCWTLGFLPPRWMTRWLRVLELEGFRELGQELGLIERARRMEAELGPAVARSLGAEACSVALRVEDSERFEVCWGPGGQEGLVMTGEPGALAGGWIGPRQHLAGDSLEALLPFAEELEAREVLVAPISEGETLQGFVVAYLIEGCPFPEDALRLALRFGEQLARVRGQAAELSTQLILVRSMRRQGRQHERRRVELAAGAGVLLEAPLHRLWGGLAELDGAEALREELAEALARLRALEGLAELETGRLRLRPTSLEPGPLIRGRCRRREVAVDLVVDDAPESARVDRRSLVRVVDALLGRAARAAGPRGRVAVTLSVEDPSHLRLAVRDPGPCPIRPEAELPTLEHLHLDGDPGLDALRLELAFARGVVELQGGAVGVEADGAGGTRCWMTLPLRGHLRGLDAGPAEGEGPRGFTTKSRSSNRREDVPRDPRAGRRRASR